MGNKDKKNNYNIIVLNKKVQFNYTIKEKFEAGIVLQGWEVKSIRAGRVQLTESYAIIISGEIFLVGAHFSPLPFAATHISTNPNHQRKLLLHKKEISQLIGATERKGYTVVVLSLYWKHGKIKANIALAKGKTIYDKRQAMKKREWNLDQRRLMTINK